MPRSTSCHAGTTPRSWAGPTSSAVCWRTSSGRPTGRSSAVLLAGDAGVGKTRLLDELAARAAERGVRVLVGHCVDLGDVGLPYLPFVDLLRPVAGDPDLAPVSAANPVLAGLLAGRASGPPPVPPASEGRDLSRPLPHRAAPQPVDDGRLQLFESVAGLICELAAAAPAADRAGGPALGRPVQPRPAALPAGPAGRRAGRRGRLLPRRRPAPPAPAPPAARRAGAAARRSSGSSWRRCPTPTSARWSAGWPRGRRAAGVDRRRRRRPRRGQRLLRRGAARRRAARRGAAARADRRPAGPGGAAVPGGAAGAADRGRRRPPGPARAGGRGRRARDRRARGGAGRGGAPPPAGRLRRRRATASGTRCCARRSSPTCCRASGCGCTPSIAAYLAATPGAGTAAERAHHARESNDLPGALQRLPRGGGGRLLGRGARRAAAAPGGGARAVAGGARRRRAGRPRPGGAAAGDGRRRAHGGGAAPGGGAAALRRSRSSGRTPTRRRGPGVHYTLAQAMVRVEDDAGAHRESAAAHGAGAGRAAVGGAHLGGGHPRADELRARADGRGRRRGRRGAGRRRRAGAGQRLVRHRGLPGAGAGRAATRSMVRRRLDEALERARRSGDVDVEMRVLFNLATVAFEAGRIEEALDLDAAGDPAGAATSASSGRSTRRSCGTCRSPRSTWPATGTRASPRPTCWPGCRRWPRTCAPPGCWCRSAGAIRPPGSGWPGRGR